MTQIKHQCATGHLSELGLLPSVGREMSRTTGQNAMTQSGL